VIDELLATYRNPLWPDHSKSSTLKERAGSNARLGKETRETPIARGRLGSREQCRGDASALMLSVDEQKVQVAIRLKAREADANAVDLRDESLLTSAMGCPSAHIHFIWRPSGHLRQRVIAPRYDSHSTPEDINQRNWRREIRRRECELMRYLACESTPSHVIARRWSASAKRFKLIELRDAAQLRRAIEAVKSRERRRVTGAASTTRACDRETRTSCRAGAQEQ